MTPQDLTPIVLMKKIESISLDDLVDDNGALHPCGVVGSCTISGSRQHNAKYADGSFSGTYFCDIEFHNCIFEDIYFRKSYFLRCHFESVEFRNCSTRQLCFEKSTVKNLIVSDCHFFDLDFTKTEVDNALFRNCEFMSCYMLEASLRNVSGENCRSIDPPFYAKKQTFTDEVSALFLARYGFTKH